METWFLIVVTVCIAALLKALFTLKTDLKTKSKWPPGPPSLPIISRIQWLRIVTSDSEATLRSLISKFGSIISIRVSQRPMIFISSHSLAHEALVQKGAIFADRPKPTPVAKFLNSNQNNISSAHYGLTWRLLRRNLTSQILHPSQINEYSNARQWVVNILITHLREAAGSDYSTSVKVVDHFQFAMFCLLVLMCFGDKLDEAQIKEIEAIQQKYILSLRHFRILNFWPRLTRVLLRQRWNELFQLKKSQEEVIIPLIRSREAAIRIDRNKSATSYVDTLFTLELQEEDGVKRKLTEADMVSACNEFLNAGTDTTSTALQWIMANLVKYPNIQEKVFEDIKGVLGGAHVDQVTEHDLSKMSYLMAVVLEGLRLHPPAHFVLPHAVTQEVELGGYTIPKDAVVNFMVGEMGRDAKVWEDPMQFKPERFLSNGGEFEITGSHEIKMMPFGAGRRICPGFGLAMLHLEYFVANLVWTFKWVAVDENEVDLTEKQEFTVVMKNPLHACISPRQIT